MMSPRARTAGIVLVCSVGAFGAILMRRACSDTSVSEHRDAGRVGTAGSEHRGAKNHGGTGEKPRRNVPLIAPRSGNIPTLPSSARILAASRPERNTAEMNELYPGFHRAYRNGADADNMAFRRRQIRACAELHGVGEQWIEWDEIQTYTVDETGRAVLSDLAIVPKTEGIDAFFPCIGEDMIGNRSFQVPPDTPRTFTIRENNLRRFRKNMSREEIAAQIPLLEKQLREQDLSPEGREHVERTLARWQCLLERGVDDAGRAACRREIGDDD
jgi:hypothetical protein